MIQIDGWNVLVSGKPEINKKCLVKAIVLCNAHLKDDGQWELDTNTLRGDIYEWKYLEEFATEKAVCENNQPSGNQ